MRDEIDSRFWIENHDTFSRELDAALASLGAWLGRTAGRGATAQLLAAVAAFSITAVTLNATALA